MYTTETDRKKRNNPFTTVAEPFLQQSGLPFTEVLTAEAIERTFAQNNALFGQDDIFSTPIVLWAFLAQVLRDGSRYGSVSMAATPTGRCYGRGRTEPS